MEPSRPLSLAVVAMVVGSGAAALVFETLWFRQCALMLGNGTWASGLVLAGFMAGLACGNGLAGARAAGWRRPLLVYAALEAFVAISGLLVVLGLPAMTRVLAPWLGSVLESPLRLDLLRLGAGFLVMALPAAGMGATLPTLVRALASQGEGFGSLLGRLYGWNTAGAVLGALAGELVLVERLGVRGAALTSAALDLGAALAALALSRRLEGAPADDAPGRPGRGRGLRFVLAAAVCGATLLALEVVWFRYLALRAISSVTSFAVMLAVVLAGIAGGGWAAGWWCRRWPAAASHAGAVACAAGVSVVAAFAALGEPTGRYLSRPAEVLVAAARLMLPTAVISGVVFVLLGASLQAELGGRARAAGIVTLANTLGAAAGALLAGFVLLPGLGIEGALLSAVCAYAAAGLLAAPKPSARPAGPVAALSLASLGLALWAFPAGRVESTIRRNAAIFSDAETRLLAVREGRLETLAYLRNERWGRPYYDLLLTNGFSMAGTGPGNQRYMKLFAYWPLALRPDAKRALLVCYGVGSTAEAFVSAPRLASLDVVDLSPDVLEMSSALLFPPGASPLDDPRTRARIEDGRFYLQVTSRRYDVITAEPPPPKNAGVASLYTREYFGLVRDRLNAGGVATHWLPVYQLSAADARAIVAAFCSVFPDCSLWSGRGFDFMLAGTRELAAGPAEADFEGLWRAPAAARGLRDIGIETPELLGTTFLGDALFLRAFAGSQPPLEDDHPLRLSPRPQYLLDPVFSELLDADAARGRFERSEWIRRTWPPGLRERTLAAYWIQDVANRLRVDNPQRLGDVRRLLVETRLEALPLLLLESSPLEVRLAEEAAARGDPDPMIPYVRGLGALAARDWKRADGLFAEAERRGAAVADIGRARAFVAELAGEAPSGP